MDTMIVFIVLVFIFLLVIYASNLSARLGQAERLNQQLLTCLRACECSANLAILQPAPSKLKRLQQKIWGFARPR